MKASELSEGIKYQVYYDGKWIDDVEYRGFVYQQGVDYHRFSKRDMSATGMSQATTGDHLFFTMPEEEVESRVRKNKTPIKESMKLSLKEINKIANPKNLLTEIKKVDAKKIQDWIGRLDNLDEEIDLYTDDGPSQLTGATRYIAGAINELELAEGRITDEPFYHDDDLEEGKRLNEESYAHLLQYDDPRLVKAYSHERMGYQISSIYLEELEKAGFTEDEAILIYGSTYTRHDLDTMFDKINNIVQKFWKQTIQNNVEGYKRMIEKNK